MTNSRNTYKTITKPLQFQKPLRINTTPLQITPNRYKSQQTFTNPGKPLQILQTTQTVTNPSNRYTSTETVTKPLRNRYKPLHLQTVTQHKSLKYTSVYKYICNNRAASKPLRNRYETVTTVTPSNRYKSTQTVTNPRKPLQIFQTVTNPPKPLQIPTTRYKSKQTVTNSPKPLQIPTNRYKSPQTVTNP